MADSDLASFRTALKRAFKRTDFEKIRKNLLIFIPKASESDCIVLVKFLLCGTCTPTRDILILTATQDSEAMIRMFLLSVIDSGSRADLNVVAKFLHVEPNATAPALVANEMHATSSEPASDKKDEEMHCVRCHDTYVQSHGDKCVVPHIFSLCIEADDDDRLRYPALCCMDVRVVVEQGFDHRMEDVKPRYCFVGSHTTDVDQVVYNGANIVHCQLDPCKLWVKEYDGLPLTEIGRCSAESGSREIGDDLEDLSPDNGSPHDAADDLEGSGVGLKGSR